MCLSVRFAFRKRDCRGFATSRFLAREREISILQVFAKRSQIAVLQILSPDNPFRGSLGWIFGGLLRRPDTHPRARTGEFGEQSLARFLVVRRGRDGDALRGWPGRAGS
jgi:hypothetical protein